MTAIDSTSLSKIQAGGDPVKFVLWSVHKISGSDTVDVSTEFSVIRAAAFIAVTAEIGVVPTLVSDTLISIPNTIGTHDAGWLIAWGSAL